MKDKQSLGDLRAKLKGGDRRSIGRANEIAKALSQARVDCGQIVALLFDPDPIVCMRAADALEKASATNPKLIAPFGSQLNGLLCEAKQKELRWHLALMAPRLRLSRAEWSRAVAALREYLGDSSSIVKTFALDALARMANRDATVKAEVLEVLREAERGGTPAMRARARKLLRSREQ